jgi:hypothetical protein
MVMLHADAAMQISSGKEATTERINRLKNLLTVPLVYATTNQTAQDNTKWHQNRASTSIDIAQQHHNRTHLFLLARQQYNDICWCGANAHASSTRVHP